MATEDDSDLIAAVEDITSYADDVVSTINPAIAMDGSNPETAPPPKREEDVWASGQAASSNIPSQVCIRRSAHGCASWHSQSHANNRKSACGGHVREGGIDTYINSSCIEHDHEWGMDVDILTLAHMLKTPVSSSLKFESAIVSLTCASAETNTTDF